MLETVLMWQLAIGLGLKFRNEGFWTATIIGTGIFLISAGLGPVYEMVVNGNFAPNNAGAAINIVLSDPVVFGGIIGIHRNKELLT